MAAATSVTVLPPETIQRLRETLPNEYGHESVQHGDHDIIVVRVPRRAPDIMADINEAAYYVPLDLLDTTTHVVLVGHEGAVNVEPGLLLDHIRAQQREDEGIVADARRNAPAAYGHVVVASPSTRDHQAFAVRIPKDSVTAFSPDDVTAIRRVVRGDIARVQSCQYAYIVAARDHERLGRRVLFELVAADAADAKSPVAAQDGATDKANKANATQPHVVNNASEPSEPSEPTEPTAPNATRELREANAATAPTDAPAAATGSQHGANVSDASEPAEAPLVPPALADSPFAAIAATAAATDRAIAAEAPTDIAAEAPADVAAEAPAGVAAVDDEYEIISTPRRAVSDANVEASPVDLLSPEGALAATTSSDAVDARVDHAEESEEPQVDALEGHEESEYEITTGRAPPTSSPVAPTRGAPAAAEATGPAPSSAPVPTPAASAAADGEYEIMTSSRTPVNEPEAPEPSGNATPPTHVGPDASSSSAASAVPPAAEPAAPLRASKSQGAATERHVSRFHEEYEIYTTPRDAAPPATPASSAPANAAHKPAAPPPRPAGFKAAIDAAVHQPNKGYEIYSRSPAKAAVPAKPAAPAPEAPATAPAAALEAAPASTPAPAPPQTPAHMPPRTTPDDPRRVAPRTVMPMPASDSGEATVPQMKPSAPDKVLAARFREAGYEVVEGLRAQGTEFAFAAHRPNGRRILVKRSETFDIAAATTLAGLVSALGADVAVVIADDIRPGARLATWGTRIEVLAADDIETLAL